jgi:antitoxin component of MazEF toxin-antitoxin module
MTEKKRTAIGGTRKVIRLGGSLAVTLPPEFAKAHNITEGDDLPYAANHLIKFIPMPEELERAVEEEPLEKLEMDYNEIVKPEERILIPASEDPVKAFLNGCDSFYQQMKNLYPDYMISHLDMVTVNIEGRKYYQPGRIAIQRIRGRIVLPIEE